MAARKIVRRSVLGPVRIITLTRTLRNQPNKIAFSPASIDLCAQHLASIIFFCSCFFRPVLSQSCCLNQHCAISPHPPPPLFPAFVVLYLSFHTSVFSPEAVMPFRYGHLDLCFPLFCSYLFFLPCSLSTLKPLFLPFCVYYIYVIV